MDPNATLSRLRELVLEIDNTDDCEDKANLANEAAELFSGLDSWLRIGGAHPAAWTKR